MVGVKQGVFYLDLLRHLMQGEAFESAQRDELVDTVHDGALVAVVAEEIVGNDFGYDGTAEG
jgi:hypothetical protein